MIQFNLLPESKLQVVKAKQSERMVILVSVIASIVSVVILIFSLLAIGVQKYSLNSAATSVTNYTNQLKQTANLNDILTVQNQLNTLVNLHSQEPLVTRLFGYLPQITPTKAGISQLTINFDTHNIQINGTADSLQSVNEFADTLKFTTYTTTAQTQPVPAFSSVVLANFGRDITGANFSFSLQYDPALFDQSQSVKLSVPQNYISTQSFLKLPNSSLFNGSASGVKQ